MARRAGVGVLSPTHNEEAVQEHQTQRRESARNKLREKTMKKERESKEFQCVMGYFEERREYCPNFTEEEFEAFKDDEKFSMFGGDFKMYENFISHSSESFLFNFYTYEGRQELYRAVCEKLAEQEEEERQDRLTQLRDRLAEQEEEEQPKKLSKGQKKKTKAQETQGWKKKGCRRR